MKGIGIVLAGGGGKGAYEIGVWKYIHEEGLDHYVRAVSGTSVGALNAALFAGSSYEIAEDLWENISQEKILTPKINIDDVLKTLSIMGIHFTGPIGRVIEKATSVVVSDATRGMEIMGQYFIEWIKADSIFSREGLIDLIKEGIIFSQLQNSDIPCYVTCFNCSSLSVERFDLRNYEESEIVKLLLASSAIPIIFPNEEIDGDKYCDGGIPFIGDNVPIQPIYDMGIEHIFVIHLSQDTLIDKAQYPNSKISEIIPSVDLGKDGVLDFTSDGAKKRIELGYADAMRILGPMVEMLKIGVANQATLRNEQNKMRKFERNKADLIKREQDIKSEMEKDGFDDMFNDLMKGL